MRRALFAMAALMAASSALAQETAATADWRECTVDADCVAVQGTCDMTSVNVASKDDAAAYYRKLHAGTTCVKRFWQPNDTVPECKPIAGSKATKTADVVPHSSCIMVPKPTAKK